MTITEVQKYKTRDNKVLAYGEVTGHMHAVAVADQNKAELYEVGNGLVLHVTGDCVRIVHGNDPGNYADVQPGEDRHGMVLLDTAAPSQSRQGDVLLTPRHDLKDCWDVTIQIEEGPDEVLRQVAD